VRTQPPCVTDALGEIHRNNTQILIEDIEAVRAHLRVEAWLVAGISWGSTLALAYAQAHPAKVTELVLVAVTTTSRQEVDWITEGMGRIFPEAWQRFAQASGKHDGERIVEAYARRLANEEIEDRLAAALAWNEWETTHISLDPNWVPIDEQFDQAQGLAFATLVTHYWANDGFLRDGREIARNLRLIAHIPGVLICGRRDISGPPITAWQLHQDWPTSELRIVETEGHGGPDSMLQMSRALDEFASK
jgi:proline iminopeptidase